MKQLSRQSISQVAPTRIMLRAVPPVLLVLVGLVVYANSFHGVFLFDDEKHITENLRIRQLLPLWETLRGRRPLVNLSLAINYAIGDMRVWGYHAFNLTVHLLAGLTLYGVIGRTLSLHRVKSATKDARSRTTSGMWLAFAAALIWLVHPLQTQSVTYVIQRAESMMGLFYLLTLYCAIRGARSVRGRYWFAASVVACALGMGSKAVMISAPAVVLLYDRVFLATSWRALLRRRWGLYAGFAATFGVLVSCGVVVGVLRRSAKNAGVGFSVSEFSWLEYFGTQPKVIVRYLRLSLWPDVLCLDYSWPAASGAVEIVLPGLMVIGLLLGTVLAFRWKPWLGFLGAWFFLILSPTSSFVPIMDVIFEHRMYLSLAAVVVLTVVSVHAGLERWHERSQASSARRWAVGAILLMGVVGALGFKTAHRNEMYRSELAMWSDVLAKQPTSERAHYAYANAQHDHARFGEAEKHYRHAIKLAPNYGVAYKNLGKTLLAMGKPIEAIEVYQQALRLMPEDGYGYYNLSLALAAADRVEEAIPLCRKAVTRKPKFDEARYQLGRLYARAGRNAEAMKTFREVLKRGGDDPRVRSSLGLALTKARKYSAAIKQFQCVLEAGTPALTTRTAAGAHYNMGNACVGMRRFDEAIEAYLAALAIEPKHARAHYWVGWSMERRGRLGEAIEHYRETLKLDPGHAPARKALEAAMVKEAAPSVAP